MRGCRRHPLPSVIKQPVDSLGFVCEGFYSVRTVDGDSFREFDILRRVLIRVDQRQFEREVPAILSRLSNDIERVDRR